MSRTQLNDNMRKIFLGLIVGVVALMPALTGCTAPVQKPVEPAILGHFHGNIRYPPHRTGVQQRIR
jgi:hypothetical protein